MVYSTPLGGSAFNQGQGIAVDALGNMYVTGYTRSADFPTFKPLQASNGGEADVFVSVLNPQGSAFIFSTYVGGRGLEIARAIAVDSSGNSYVTGYTASPDFPLSQPISTAGSSFVFKLNAAGSAFAYSTRTGIDGDGFGIAVDPTGNAYSAGQREFDGGPNCCTMGVRST